MSDIDRVRDVIWLTNGLRNIATPQTGLVLYECEFGGFKGYVSVVEGRNERADIQHIIEWGGRIPDPIAARLWPHVETWYDSRDK